LKKSIALESTDDFDAIEKGKSLLDGRDIEIWQGVRVVVKLFHPGAVRINLCVLSFLRSVGGCDFGYRRIRPRSICVEPVATQSVESVSPQFLGSDR
jgi:hypothetical protein